MGPSGLVEMQQLENRANPEANPKILLRAARSTYTSVCLPLVKPG